MIFRTIFLVCAIAPFSLFGKSKFPDNLIIFNSSELKILITPPPLTLLYSDCESPEVLLTIQHPGITSRSATLQVELPPSIYLSSKDWVKIDKGIWVKTITLPGLEDVKLSLPLDILSKSAIASAKVKVVVTTHEEQSVHKAETMLSSRSATDLSENQKTVSVTQLLDKKILTPLLTDCGLGAYYLSGEVIVDQDIDFEQSATQFIVAPDTRVVVKSGATLTLNNAVFSSCGTWSGIYVEPGGNLLLNNTLVQNTNATVTYLNAPLTKELRNPVEAYAFPNPSSGNVTVHVDGQKVDDKCTVLVEDEQGKNHAVSYRVSASGTEINVEMGHLANGFYVVQVKTSDGLSCATKIMVEHK